MMRDAMKSPNDRRSEPLELDAQQRFGLNDMDPDAIQSGRALGSGHHGDYLAGIRDRSVFPPVEPGSLRPLFAATPPETPEPIADILADYRLLIEPNVTHWQHRVFSLTSVVPPPVPGSSARCSRRPQRQRDAVANQPGRDRVGGSGRRLAAPGHGLADGFRWPDHRYRLDVIPAGPRSRTPGCRYRGGGGWPCPVRPDVPRLRVYASAEAHSSIEKACMTLGLGRDGLTRVATNDRFELRIDALEEAIAADRAAGVRPIAIVGTIGTTSTTSRDPIGEMSRIARREGLWLHVDAAYAGVVAIIPELRSSFEGWEDADSIVTNPHKWWYATRRRVAPADPAKWTSCAMRSACSRVPADARSRRADPGDYNEYTQLWVVA